MSLSSTSTRTFLLWPLDEPAPDFAAIARGFGWWADGPVTDPDRVRAAVREAAEHVLATGRPALVDVVCQPK